MTEQRDPVARRRFAPVLALGLLAQVFAAEIPTPARAPATIQEGKSQPPAALVLKLNDAYDAARVAHELARSFLSEEQMKSRAAEVRRKFADWEKDNTGDIGSYLNYKLPVIALSVSGGKIERIKEGTAFLALYYEFGEPPPQIVTAFARDNLTSLNTLFAAFTWEKAAEYVKNKQWQKDREAEKKKAASKQ